jgi:hypothetical protein
MKTRTILIATALFFTTLICRAADSAIPPEIEKQFDPDVLSGKRPKTVILMQSMILGLREQPKLDADFVTIGFTYSGLSQAQRSALESWFQTGSNKVYLDLRPSNIYDTASGRSISAMPADLLQRMFKCKVLWVSEKAVTKHAVNAGCNDLRMGYYHSPRDNWGMKEGDVVALSGFPSEGSEVVLQGTTNAIVAGKFVYGKTECFYLGAALGGPSRLRWEKNYWQWALGLKIPGAADNGATGQ